MDANTSGAAIVPVTVPVSGDIDIATVPELRRRIRAEIDANPGADICLDLSGLTFIDSTGLGVLVGSLKHARLQGGDVWLAEMPPTILNVFKVTGLTKVFRITEGTDQGAA
jgi:anti-sigma B factor antagonist